MSEANRRATYNKLVSLGRFDQIDPSLVKEFGDPIPKVENCESKKKNIFKRGKKK